MNMVRLGVMTGSVLSAVAGYLVLKRATQGHASGATAGTTA
jgi:hypothetical protein